MDKDFDSSNLPVHQMLFTITVNSDVANCALNGYSAANGLGESLNGSIYDNYLQASRDFDCDEGLDLQDLPSCSRDTSTTVVNCVLLCDACRCGISRADADANLENAATSLVGIAKTYAMKKICNVNQRDSSAANEQICYTKNKVELNGHLRLVNLIMFV